MSANPVDAGLRQCRHCLVFKLPQEFSKTGAGRIGHVCKRCKRDREEARVAKPDYDVDVHRLANRFLALPRPSKLEIGRGRRA